MNEEKKYVGRGGWRGGGRPKKEKSDAAITATLGLVMMPEEKTKIMENAKARNMSISRYVVSQCLG